MNIGERIGDYEIVAILGAGGMGQVYKVRNVLSDRVEAMKVLLPNLEGDPDLADRFLREIKVQAALDHPHIAKLHTAMRAGNQLVMVMEFVEGTSLAQQLEQGPMPAMAVVSAVAQVLDALAYAHARGVIHRDIKPANIMMASLPSGKAAIKLMDFGIARMQADRQITQTGSTVGSLYYMSPEQINGRTPDPRSDLYSLGITMYEMVTGRRPFLGDSDYSIMSAHLQQAPAAPIEIIPGVPPILNDLILMAIEKDPAARFQSAEAFRAAIGNAFPQAAATKTMDVIVPPAPLTAPPPISQVPISQVKATPPPVPPPHPSATAAPKSRRGVYITVGALAALIVLAAAVVEGPKLMRSGTADVPARATQPASKPAPEAVALPEPQPVAEPIKPVETPVAQPVREPARAAVRQALPIPQPAGQPGIRPVENARQERTSPSQIAPPAAPPVAASQPSPAAVPAPQPVEAPIVQPAPAPPKISDADRQTAAELQSRYQMDAAKAALVRQNAETMRVSLAARGMSLNTQTAASVNRFQMLLDQAAAALRERNWSEALSFLQAVEAETQKVSKAVGQ